MDLGSFSLGSNHHKMEAGDHLQMCFLACWQKKDGQKKLTKFGHQEGWSVTGGPFPLGGEALSFPLVCTQSGGATWMSSVREWWALQSMWEHSWPYRENTKWIQEWTSLRCVFLTSQGLGLWVHNGRVGRPSLCGTTTITFLYFVPTFK